MEKIGHYSETDEVLANLGLLGNEINSLHSKLDEIIDWINEQEKERKE